MFCTSVSLPGKQVGLELGCFPPEAPVCFSLDCPPIQDLVALDVTSSSFHVSWSLNSTQNHTFHVQVYKSREMLRSTQTRSRTLAVPGLEAGVLYRVRASYQGCGANVSATLLVKTGKTLAESHVSLSGHFCPRVLGTQHVTRAFLHAGGGM